MDGVNVLSGIIEVVFMINIHRHTPPPPLPTMVFGRFIVSKKTDLQKPLYPIRSSISFIRLVCFTEKIKSLHY